MAAILFGAVALGAILPIIFGPSAYTPLGDCCQGSSRQDAERARQAEQSLVTQMDTNAVLRVGKSGGGTGLPERARRSEIVLKLAGLVLAAASTASTPALKSSAP